MSKCLVDITGMIPIYYFKIPVLIKIGIFIEGSAVIDLESVSEQSPTVNRFPLFCR